MFFDGTVHLFPDQPMFDETFSERSSETFVFKVPRSSRTLIARAVERCVARVD
jgi:hypothetical protein